MWTCSEIGELAEACYPARMQPPRPDRRYADPTRRLRCRQRPLGWASDRHTATMTYTFASATILLILITDPIGNIPIFANALRHVAPQRRPWVILREV
jgi:hypothetical protein